jgi:hypothetical protein
MSTTTAETASTGRPSLVSGLAQGSAWRRDLVTSLLGLWLVAAVFTDGWAHLNRPGLETFFTPWHAALYSGLVAFAGWLTLLAWRGRRATGSLWAGLPAGYALAAVGVALFGAGGVADLGWHELFGIEVAVDALLSPSHLMLLGGGLLIVSTGWRAQRAVAGRRGTVPELLSLTATAGLAAFFLSYASAFTQTTPTTVFHNVPEGAPGHAEAELPVVAALAAYLVSSALIVVPLLIMVVSGRRPRGAMTVLVGATAGLSVALVDFPGTAVAGAIGATVGAVVADALLSWVRPELATSRVAVPGVAAATVLLVWAGQLAGFAAYDAVRWPVSLWSGVVLVAGLSAAALASPIALTARSREHR